MTESLTPQEIDQHSIASQPTYTGRQTGLVTVSSLTENSIGYDNGTGHALFDSMTGKVKVGDTLVLETRNFSMVLGVRYYEAETWLFRKSDQEVEAERIQTLKDLQVKKVATLAANREDWQARTDALPEWIKERIAKFQESGLKFELNGWGYELVIAELAVLYQGPRYEDTPEIKAYADMHGTSGNQHQAAIWLAKEHDQGNSLAGTVSGLMPITGDPYYTNEQEDQL